MLTIDGKKISLSKGDTFDVTFAVNGYRLKDGDSVIFSIKNTAHSFPTRRSSDHRKSVV